MVYYRISHLTLFKYSAPVSASMTEVRMRPLHSAYQHTLTFELTLSPRARLLEFEDYLGNTVHVFDVPGKHNKLAIKVNAIVEVEPMPPLPDALPPGAWEMLANMDFSHETYDMLQPSHFVRPSSTFEQFADEIQLRKLEDPLTTLLDVNARIFNSITYQQNVTEVDSPIEDAIEQRQGVCQDYSHIMLTVVRGMGIPCRYVSGYLYHHRDYNDRSVDDATHAWVEAWLPTLGWVGFDPTNNLVCGERHIRVCVGHDYADAAPTRGVFSGDADTELTVQVQVTQLEQLPADAIMSAQYGFALPDYEHQQIQQQQQQ